MRGKRQTKGYKLAFGYQKYNQYRLREKPDP